MQRRPSARVPRVGRVPGRARRRVLRVALLPLSTALAPAVRAADAPLVAAASDLKFALDEIAQRFVAQGGPAPRIVYGASGNFHRQIVQGAPFELFLSADEDFVLRLAAEGLARDAGVRYARGGLVLFAAHGSLVRPDDGLAGLRAAVADGRLRRLAIANPAHAPYGRAAAEALRAAGAWDAVQPRLVFGETASQAAQFAASGSAQAGVFAHALAVAPAVASKGRFVDVPQALHAPLDQRMALTTRAGPGAEAFYRFVQGPDARAVLARHGFRVPQPADASAEATRPVAGRRDADRPPR